MTVSGTLVWRTDNYKNNRGTRTRICGEKRSETHRYQFGILNSDSHVANKALASDRITTKLLQSCSTLPQGTE